MAECGVASRRASEKLIQEGRVKVNGAVATLGQSVEPGVDRVELDGQSIVGRDAPPVYILLNKPSGFVTSAKDPKGRPTVLDCLKGVTTRVYPVGRLDLDVEGALILTNDGDLAHRLMHPSHEVPKVYQAWVQGRMEPETLTLFEKGILLEDGMAAPAKAEVLHEGPSSTLVQLTLHEGRNHEVKRLCAAVGHSVKHLKRVAVGQVRLKDLRPGEWRHLSEREVRLLKRTAGLKHAPTPRSKD
jgi:pseudouridine synthase